MRDPKYNEKWLLDMRKKIMLSFFSDEELLDIFVLKGGNALELIYKVTKRPSLDIDLSMEEDFIESDLSRIEEKIFRSLNDTFRDDGLEVVELKFEEKPAVEKRKTPRGSGYQITFKLIEKGGGVNHNRALEIAGSKKTFHVDISKYEYCESKVKMNVDGYTVYVYSPEMIILEKMRAICQQTKEYRSQENSGGRPRPKDFYDIYMLINKMKINIRTPENALMLRKIFEKKRVPSDLLMIIKEYREYHRNGFRELLDTLPERERNISYDEIFDAVTEKMESIHQTLKDI